MTKSLLALFALLLAVLPGTPALGAESPPWSGDKLIDDPEWRNRFLGSYGFLSGAEPPIAPTELEAVREVLELMKADPRAASAALQQQITPESSASLDFILANLEFQNGALDLAAKYYGRALEKFPDFRRAHKNLGLLLVQKGDFAGGLEHLTRALELGDRDGRTYGLIGYCYVNQENFLAAEQAYRNAVMQQPETRDWKLGLARSLLAMEEYQAAVALFGSLIAADPDDTTSWLLQANAYVGLEQPRAAAVNLEAVRMMGAAQTSSLVLLGDIYMNAGMPGLARSAYLEVIEKDAKGAEFTTAYRAADLLVRARAFKDAEAILASLESRYGKQLPQENRLKLLTLQAKVARSRGQKQEAAKLLESIVEQDGTRGDALLELASYYREQGQDAKALLMIERAQNIAGFEYRALLAHAQFVAAQKDYDEAAELLRRALGIKNEPRVARYLARIEEARRR